MNLPTTSAKVRVGKQNLLISKKLQSLFKTETHPSKTSA